MVCSEPKWRCCRWLRLNLSFHSHSIPLAKNHNKKKGLTNYQSTEDHTTRTISRGDLIPYFLEQHKQLVTSATSSEKIIEGVFSIATRISQSILQYPGFNLICGDVREPKSFVCISNRSVSCSPLPLTTGNGTSSGVGIHVLTNGLIDDPWPKAEHGRKIFQLLIRSIDSTTKNTSLAHCLFHQLLSDTTPFPLHELPQTGVSDDERLLCGPICVKGCRYGTRAMTVVISDSKTQLLIIERARQFKEGEGASGEEWAPTTEQEMQLETWTDCDIAVPLSNTFTA
eukprot:c7402_g1_i3.p1 GENE.c7402_g1_i3~~c7402_g1_i3.p1  ORF type:complete len:284 (+),score=36.62 c7402_g1_i3:209-1060(+)